MSDTDDTDVLLLIPPDFFLIHTDSDDSYHDKVNEHCDSHCGVVNTLITQVNKLENRLNKIEVNSEISHFSSVSSCNSTIIPLSDMSEQPSINQNYPNDSIKNTPPKSRSKVVTPPSLTPKNTGPRYKRPPRYTSRFASRIVPGLNVHTSGHGLHHDADESSSSISPEKLNSKKVLGEIDHFLNSVKTIQTASAESKKSQSLIKVIEDPTITIGDLNSTEIEAERRFSRLNLRDVDHLLNVMDSQQKLMEETDRIESLYENENFFKSQHSWKCGELKESVPELGFGMRDLIYSNEDFVRPSEERKSTGLNLETIPQESDSQTNSEPTVVENNLQDEKCKQTKSVKNVVNNISVPQLVLPQFQRNLKNDFYNNSKEDMKSNSNCSNLPVQVSHQGSSDSSINLFSLADIWNSNNIVISDKHMEKLWPKLEEEKCRRRHCEKLIQELQGKILEMQQRLAVAVQVDTAKDEAILKFHEAWEKVACRWKSLEMERNSLSQKLISVEEKSSMDLAEAAQKVVQYEIEVSKALDLAHNSQDKCKTLETERSEFLFQINELQVMMKKSEEELQKFEKQKEELSDKISLLEKESLADKKLLLESQSEITKSKAACIKSQNELSALKDDYSKLQKKISEKQNQIYDLESQKNKLQLSFDTIKQNESMLQQQIKSLQEESERVKFELRSFYQQQVEILVKDKLKEFQEQLERAEKNLQDELQNREQIIAKTAAKQLQKLSEKHRLEVQLIEEKHKEEVRLYELQFSQMKQEIEILQNKIESYHHRRTHIAQELHNVMEQQWLQALKIINNGKSPLPGSPHVNVGPTKEETPSLNCRAIETIFLRDIKEEESETGAGDFEKQEDDRNNIKLRSRNTVTDNNQFRSLQPDFNTPVTSKLKHEISPENSDTELQKYIKLLLSKMPKTSEKPSKEDKKVEVTNHDSNSSGEFVDVMSWSQFPPQKGSIRSTLISSKEQRSGKPPWK